MQPSILSQKTAARAKIVAAAPAALEPAGSQRRTSAAVRAATADAVDRHQCDHYSRRPGIAPLCQAVAAHLSALGVQTQENDVVISGSIQEARYVALRALAVGKTVYVSAPDPHVYAAALQFAGATVVVLEGDQELPDAASGLVVVGPGHVGVPTDPHEGVRATPERLAAWVAENELAVVADETGAPLDDYTPFASLPGMAAHTLTLGSFDGAPGLGAWQVSWFAGPKPLLTPVRDLKQSITICTSAPSQYAALAALKEYTAAASPGQGAGAQQGAQP
jgi:aspartate/methionine/tyrosine aminotransferase